VMAFRQSSTPGRGSDMRSRRLSRHVSRQGAMHARGRVISVQGGTTDSWPHRGVARGTREPCAGRLPACTVGP
jgi:hypothetical protein